MSRRVRGPCICGCGKRGLRHHVIYQQKLREIAGRDHDREFELCIDARNIVRVAPACHAAHHRATLRLFLTDLPDSVFEFAAEVLGPGPAFEYLRRRYDGLEDPRLAWLLAEHDRAAV